MGRKRKLKSPPSKIRAEQRYCERQRAMGRRSRKFWTTDEETRILRQVLANLRAKKRSEEADDEETTAETKRSACL